MNGNSTAKDSMEQYNEKREVTWCIPKMLRRDKNAFVAKCKEKGVPVRRVLSAIVHTKTAMAYLFEKWVWDYLTKQNKGKR